MPSQNYIEEIREIWNMVKESFRPDLSETSIDLWFGEITVVSFQDSPSENSNAPEYTLTLGIPSVFKFDIVKNKYLSTIEKKFCQLLGFDVKVNLIFTGSATEGNIIRSKVIGIVPPPVKLEPKNPLNTLTDYNFEYTFENFIVGSTNKFAHAACYAVANRPANYESDPRRSITTYNPLFIYGNSGLGKTHLMHATINRLKQNNPDIKIIYTRGEDFTNQMIDCLANKTMSEFHDKYRNCDVLLIDDIQFIAGKTSTQEEFFHTFNALYDGKKQIILTSDRPPHDIKQLEDRLKSRFEWGLLADIEPPDLELRIAIIKKKAEQVNITLPDDVLTFLGENLRSNIRQIEGAIKKLGALSFLSGKEINMELAQECISELLGGAEPVSVTVDKIFNAVFNKYGISKESLTGNRRNKDIANTRHIAIYLIRELTEMSFPSIAKIFERDHSTIISSHRLMEGKLLEDPEFLTEINDLKKSI